jgi:hypothetical protein
MENFNTYPYENANISTWNSQEIETKKDDFPLTEYCLDFEFLM